MSAELEKLRDAVIDAARHGWARAECGSCDYGLAMGCGCTPMNDAINALEAYEAATPGSLREGT